MKKVLTYNGYTYYIGSDNGNPFYNIVPYDQIAPNGGYAKEYILKVKNLPDLFNITKDELFTLNKAKTYLIKESSPSFEGQARNRKVLENLAAKYKVDIQVISDLMPIK